MYLKSRFATRDLVFVIPQSLKTLSLRVLIIAQSLKHDKFGLHFIPQSSKHDMLRAYLLLNHLDAISFGGESLRCDKFGWESLRCDKLR